MTWGVRPQAMIGHSIGEYVAACLAGVFGLEDGLKLVAARGRMMQDLPHGAMLAVSWPFHKVESLLGEHLSIAAINEPSLTVVSGPLDEIAVLETRLADDDVECRHLQTSHAFHSSMMDPILDPFIAEVGRIDLRPPRIPFVSNVSGTWITAAEATDATYWARHFRLTVRFSDGVVALSRESTSVLLEVGPGNTLSTLARRTLVRHQEPQGGESVFLSSMRHPQKQESDSSFLLGSLGRAWLAGVGVDWNSFHKDERRHRVPLPTYPFERQRFWIDPIREGPSHGLRRNTDLEGWTYVPSWKRTPPIAQVTQDRSGDPESQWLVFSDGGGLGDHVVKRLDERGQKAVVVSAGDRFSRLGDREYVINPKVRADYEELFDELEALGKTPRRILHLWSVTSTDSLEQLLGSPNCGPLDLGFYSLIFLAQALGERGSTEPTRLGVVTTHVQEVTGDEVICPGKGDRPGAVHGDPAGIRPDCVQKH